MNKVAHYLQEHLSGEVMTGVDARKYFATDGSIFALPPAIVVYPRNENDIRKAARFSWQLAERGRIIPITARGSGTDQGGAALGSGIMLVFPAHLNRILELDGKTGAVVVEPGINYGKLQQTLLTHNRHLPPYPSSLEYSTIGGAVANNAAGEKSIKYGNTLSYVKKLRVVLANGEVIEVKRINKRELNKKLGLATFEGEIYRNIDKIIEENKETIKAMRDANSAAGYGIGKVKRKDGSIDLTPLIVGSQGTLGLVSEVTLTTEVHNAESTVIAAKLTDFEQLNQLIKEVTNLPSKPSSFEMVNEHLLEFVHGKNPNQLKSLLQPPFPKFMAIIELDDLSDRVRKRLTKRITKILNKHNFEFTIETNQEKQDDIWRIRQSASSLIAHGEGDLKALPIIEDVVVPTDKVTEFLRAAYDMLRKQDIEPAAWGSIGTGSLHIRPLLDLNQVGDRQKVFKVMEDYYALAISMGGSTNSSHNDGRLRAPYLKSVYGPEVYKVFEKIKQAFDPYGTLNPGVKIGVTLDDVKPLVRQSFGLDHFYDHLPRS